MFSHGRSCLISPKICVISTTLRSPISLITSLRVSSFPFLFTLISNFYTYSMSLYSV
uniref:Uncharacterized protein n=1 Tax=Helianthus annuus TaxID=4232 RepID=A0A251T4B1_HELAN